MKRAIFDIILFIFVFLLPWWVTLVWAILGLFVFVSFYEFLISIIMIYIISVSSPSKTILSNPVFVYSSIIIFYLLVQYLHRHIILYKDEISHKS
jgi:hypothetical protein